jgi:hypothetical protein
MCTTKLLIPHLLTFLKHNFKIHTYNNAHVLLLSNLKQSYNQLNQQKCQVKGVTKEKSAER